MFLVREFEQEITRKSVFISSDLPSQLFDFNVIQVSQICIQHDSMATDDTDGLLNSFRWHRYVHVLLSICRTYRQWPDRDTVLIGRNQRTEGRNGCIYVELIREASGCGATNRYIGNVTRMNREEKGDLLNACLALQPAHILHDLIDIPGGHTFDLRHIAEFPMVRLDAVGCSPLEGRISMMVRLVNLMH